MRFTPSGRVRRSGAVYSQILYGTDLHAYQGASGPIQFDRTGAPVGRPLTMLCVADLKRGFAAGSTPIAADRIDSDPADRSPPSPRCPG